jgi:hypothetical protein
VSLNGCGATDQPRDGAAQVRRRGEDAAGHVVGRPGIAPPVP